MKRDSAVFFLSVETLNKVVPTNKAVGIPILNAARSISPAKLKII